MTDIILHEYKNGKPVRIFRPYEIHAILRAIPKNEYKDKLEALLFSGCRYSEMKWLYDNKSYFKGSFLKIKNTKILIKQAYRYVKLNNQGQRSIENFLRCKTNLPSYATWNENLKRWCEKANIEPDNACAKSTRKTWESWLVIKYPSRIAEIFISQGHMETTALRHYLMFPFSDIDKNDMKYFTDGW